MQDNSDNFNSRTSNNTLFLTFFLIPTLSLNEINVIPHFDVKNRINQIEKSQIEPTQIKYHKWFKCIQTIFYSIAQFGSVFEFYFTNRVKLNQTTT